MSKGNLGNLPFRTVFLVGFMGSGKTSVGQVLAALLDRSFVDLDDRIQAREGRSIAEIFRQSGESSFRDSEHEALRDLLEEVASSPARVVSLGGGAFAQARNAALLADDGSLVVFLDAAPSELLRRCREQGTERPLSQDEKRFHELYVERKPHYLKAALRIDTTGREIHAIAREIAARLEVQAKSAKEK
jgi:shikimate kinase